MRTKPPHILPGCPWCNSDHDPAIECRNKPESPRFQLNHPKKRITKVTVIRDANGKIIAAKTTFTESE